MIEGETGGIIGGSGPMGVTNSAELMAFNLDRYRAAVIRLFIAFGACFMNIIMTTCRPLTVTQHSVNYIFGLWTTVLWIATWTLCDLCVCRNVCALHFYSGG